MSAGPPGVPSAHYRPTPGATKNRAVGKSRRYSGAFRCREWPVSPDRCVTGARHLSGFWPTLRRTCGDQGLNEPTRSAVESRPAGLRRRIGPTAPDAGADPRPHQAPGGWTAWLRSFSRVPRLSKLTTSSGGWLARRPAKEVGDCGGRPPRPCCRRPRPCRAATLPPPRATPGHLAVGRPVRLAGDRGRRGGGPGVRDGGAATDLQAERTTPGGPAHYDHSVGSSVE